MTPTDSSGRTVVFRRDPRPASRRWWRWAIPLVVVGFGGGAVGGILADRPGDVSFFAGFGVVVLAAVLAGPRLADRPKRVNATITTDGSKLYWSRHAVPVHRVRSWDAAIRTTTFSNGRTTSHISVAAADFELDDGRTETFAFPYLGSDGLAALRSALAAVLPVAPRT